MIYKTNFVLAVLHFQRPTDQPVQWSLLNSDQQSISPYNRHAKTGKPGIEKTEDDPKGGIVLRRNHYKKCVDKLHNCF